MAGLTEELRRQGRYSVDDLAELMAARLQPWSAGREEMKRHITKRQVIRLVTDDLLGSAVRVNAGLSVSELSGSIVLPNARLVLSEILECGGAGLTAAGFLKRTFVMQIGGRLDWPDFDWEMICAVSKSPREAEIGPLWFLHGVLKLAGLLYARHGTLHIGRRGRELIAPERAGDLQATLFRATWRELDLASLARIALGERLQGQGNLLLFMIGRLADEWIDSEPLLHASLVPDHEILAAPEHLPLYAFEGCILRPLRWFGLIDIREIPTDIKWRSRREVRKTALFDRFLAFDPGLA